MISKDEFTEAQERRFLAWIRTLPSVLSGDKHNIEACHVLSVAHGAGKGRKPRLFALPLTHTEHQIQSHHGYYAVLRSRASKAVLLRFYADYSQTDPKAGLNWFKEQALMYRERFLELDAKGLI